MQPIAMTVLLAVSFGVFAWSARRRWRLMRIGTPASRFDQVGRRLRLTWRYAIQQLRMRRYPVSGVAHMLVFSGFVVLLVRSLMLWVRGYDEGFSFWVLGPDQALGKFYGLAKDVFVVLVLIGTAVFFHVRVIKRLPRLSLNFDGLIVLVIIAVMMLADVLYDGASLAMGARGGATGAAPSFHPWEPVGSIVQYAVAGLPSGGLAVARHVGFWTHVALVLIFLNLLPYSKHFHVITGIPNVFFQDLAPPGRLPPLEDIEGRLEREETLGIRRIDQFSWKSILDFYTCTECGRCSDHCPATHTGKKLSPKHLTVDLRNFLYRHGDDLVSARAGASAGGGATGGGTEGSDGGADGADDPAEWNKDLVDGVIDPEVLWACTTCRACEQECPVFISYVDKIVDMRRYLAQERGEFPKELQTAFRGLESSGNPFCSPPDERMKWADGLDVRTLADHPGAEVLLWVGCAAAFDDRARKIARATARLLARAGVDFAVLGTEEQCTGDPARRAGNEFLFQMMAQANVETLNGYGCADKTIVTPCPHCYNTLAHEYPDFGGRYTVVHHTTFLADLVQRGTLTPSRRVERTVAYHDSCYLGRYNEVYDAPREVLKSIPGLTIIEPARTRDRGMCCGAGGAQMFKEEEPGDARVNDVRTRQLLDTGADAISSACPFCMRMLTNGLADQEREDVAQLDVAEMLWEAMGPTNEA